jgi:putative PIG3 family NAD(P)H quinone oxidoreductase
MRAVQLHSFGGAEELFIGDVPKPVRKSGEVLVKVHASALNRADLLQRQGKYPPPEGESDILGLEMAGEVVEVNSESNWQIGDKVMSLLAGGGQAEFVAVPESLLMPIPGNLGYTEAAAIPEVFLTAYQNLFFEGKTKSGQTALIHAGGSGVGTAAIQLAKIEGIRSYVTCSSGKHKTCLDLGAELAIDYKTEAFDEVILEATDYKGVNIILDFIGGPNFKPNIRSLANEGKLVMIALMGGLSPVDINLMPILHKHLTIFGTTLRSRSLEYKAKLVENFTKIYLPSFESEELKPVVDSIYKLEDIQLAHIKMEANENLGKIALDINA